MTWLTALWASERGKQLLGFAGTTLALIALVGLLYGLHRCSANDQADQAVQVDRADAVAEATNRVLAADRATAVNQQQREAEMANQQEQLRDEAKEHGSGDAVGPGVAAVLTRMREQQRPR